MKNINIEDCINESRKPKWDAIQILGWSALVVAIVALVIY